MDAHSIMTEQVIQNYLATIDFKNANFSVAKMKSELKQLLGETPAVKINWDAQTHLNEVTGDTTRTENIVSVTVAYSSGEDEKGMPIIKRFETFI
jgi:hypothetical protein